MMGPDKVLLILTPPPTAPAAPGSGEHWEDWTGAWETQQDKPWEEQQT